MSNEDPILDEEQTFAEEEEAWGSRKESNVGAGTFLGSVILVAGLGGGELYMQYAGLQPVEAAQAKIKEAIEVLDNDGSFGAVNRARKAFNDALVEVSDDAIATSKLALLEAQSLLHDGDAEARTRALAALEVAEANGFEKGERFAAQALLDLADNKPDKVIADLKAIFEKRAVTPGTSSLSLGLRRPCAARRERGPSRSVRLQKRRRTMSGSPRSPRRATAPTT